MLKLLQESVAIAWSNLGYCRRCIRKALIAAMCGWFGVLTAFMLDWTTMLPAIAACSIALTVLWVAHVAAFITRRVNATLRTTSGILIREDQRWRLPRAHSPPQPLHHRSHRQHLRIVLAADF